MQLTQLNGRLLFRLVLLGLGMAAAIAVLPTPNQNAWLVGDTQNPTVQQTSLEFVLERKF